MMFNSIGDLASRLMLNQSNQQAKGNLVRLSQELTTGLTSDVGGALRNDFAIQAGWERTISASEVREKTLTQSMTRVQAKQTVLDTINGNSIDLANNISTAVTSGTISGLDAVSTNAKDALAQALSQLNVQSAGRSLFAGSSTDGPATADVEIVMSSVSAAFAGAVTNEDITTALQNWMDDTSGGFEAIAYLGDDENSGVIRLDEGRVVNDSTRANDPALKQTLQNLILASVATDEGLALSAESKASLLEEASSGLRAAAGQVTNLHASLGYIEGQIADGIVQAGAEISTAQMLRTDVLGVDQYETASKLQEAELQLEKIYLLTSRTSQMSLLEYL
ncbi:flagellin [Planktotalea sp.]|uniref:flagellin n=1 Tax=Planktotalea sp. TaxID=2029877 RepID=UPI0032975DB8